MATVFDSNDDAYQAWLVAHPRGYVLNVRRNLAPSYMVLHRTSCYTIRNYHERSKPGGFTERGYIKVCADELADLRAWVRRHGRPDGSFSKECSRCGR